MRYPHTASVALKMIFDEPPVNIPGYLAVVQVPMGKLEIFWGSSLRMSAVCGMRSSLVFIAVTISWCRLQSNFAKSQVEAVHPRFATVRRPGLDCGQLQSIQHGK